MSVLKIIRLIAHHGVFYLLNLKIIWWNGSKFLTDTSFVYPTVQQVMPEIELASLNANVHILDYDDSFLPRLLSYYKLTRLMAICLRFVNMCKNKTRCYNPISMGELRNAEYVIIKIVQRDPFENEISELKKCKPLPKKNQLIR